VFKTAQIGNHNSRQSDFSDTLVKIKTPSCADNLTNKQTNKQKSHKNSQPAFKGVVLLL